MKNVYCIFINDVVHNFQWIGLPVKNDKQTFIFGIFLVNGQTITFSCIYCSTDISLAYTMFKCGYSSELGVYAATLALIALVPAFAYNKPWHYNHH